jgi:hypothetical protein
MSTEVNIKFARKCTYAAGKLNHRRCQEFPLPPFCKLEHRTSGILKTAAHDRRAAGAGAAVQELVSRTRSSSRRWLPRILDIECTSIDRITPSYSMPAKPSRISTSVSSLPIVYEGHHSLGSR